MMRERALTWWLLPGLLFVLSCSTGTMQSPDDDTSLPDDDSGSGGADDDVADDDDDAGDDDTGGDDDDSGNVSPFVGEYGGLLEIQHLTPEGPIPSCSGSAFLVVTESGELSGSGECMPSDPGGSPVPVGFEGGVAADGSVLGLAIHQPPNQQPEAYALSGLFEIEQFGLGWTGTLVSQTGEAVEFEGFVIGQPR